MRDSFSIPIITELIERVDSLEKQAAELKALQSGLTKPTAVKEWYSLEEAAQFLDMSQKSVRRLVERGLLKRSLGIRHIKIPADSLAKYKASTLS